MIKEQIARILGLGCAPVVAVLHPCRRVGQSAEQVLPWKAANQPGTAQAVPLRKPLCVSGDGMPSTTNDKPTKRCPDLSIIAPGRWAARMPGQVRYVAAAHRPGRGRLWVSRELQPSGTSAQRLSLGFSGLIHLEDGFLARYRHVGSWRFSDRSSPGEAEQTRSQVAGVQWV